jgi:hypothetical protein
MKFSGFQGVGCGKQATSNEQEASLFILRLVCAESLCGTIVFYSQLIFYVFIFYFISELGCNWFNCCYQAAITVT